MQPPRDWQAEFNETFSVPASVVQARIWAEVFGDEYPAALDTYSYVTFSELDRIGSALGLQAGDTLLDLGCGRGGPGLWMAAQTGAKLIGVDIAAEAVSASQQRAESLGMSEMAEFRVGTFEDTGLPDGSVGGIMSIDALLFTPDKPAAISELARVLGPAGHLVATTWDYSSQPTGRPPQVGDHRPLLEKAGFAVLAYEETDRWRERLEETDALLFEAVDELAAELGFESDELLERLREAHDSIECMTRRVLFAAERVP